MSATVYIVTPCMNAVQTIDRTIQSVLSQAGDFRIRYHIQDGGSTDGTRERIAAWQQRLQQGGFLRQCQGIRFSHASEADSGMYDALVKGFAKVGAHANGFMTWINADDILLPGAVALAATLERQFSPAQLSWFGGAACILRDDMITASFDRPVPREAIRRGLCDGKYWDYLQQEGTFFRKWLWDAVDPVRSIAPMRLAGDWNLWRLMSGKAGFVQAMVPIGGEVISEGQLPASQRDKYLAEMAAQIPEPDRRAGLEAMCSAGPVTRRRLKAVQGSVFAVFEETIDHTAKHHWQRVVGSAPAWGGRSVPPMQKFADGKAITHAPVDAESPEFADITPLVSSGPGWIALDADWQFPAVTEQHAWHRIRDGFATLPEGALYVAFPWATLIDKLQKKTADSGDFLEMLEQFCRRLPPDGRRVTVCQHIHAHLYLDLFRQAGIADVFWTHATHANVAEARAGTAAPRLWPFPLFPVQVQQALPEAGPDFDVRPRRHLFSFIGARANKYYLTEARNWILDLLGDDPRGLVVGRDNWHYQKVVYELQVNRTSHQQTEAATLVDQSASEQFRAGLIETTFALCPSGTGPNSIRLWESLGAGSIPVILADTWAPPGDPRLWELAAVFCKETPEDIKALPDRLAAIAAEPGRLAQMRHAMRQIWLLYGPQSFVTDVQAFLLEQGRPDPLAAQPVPADPLAGLQGVALLQAAAGALLLDPAATLGRIAGDAALAAALEAARAAQPAHAALVRHYDAVRAHVAAVTPAPAPAAPQLQRGAAPRIHFFGRHANRTPLSYAPIRNLVGERLETVADPALADLLVSGFNIDLRENIDMLGPLLDAAKPPKVAILSEEPLWDVTWSGAFTGRNGQIKIKDRMISYAFLGHETSEIYDFARIPYFVLTSESYAVRYANMMARFRDVTSAALLARWRQAPVPAAFFAEHRSGEAYAGSFPERDVTRLGGYRTEVAQAMPGTEVLRVGKGWGSDGPRQALPDWHLDKLAHLDGRTRILAAIENVHQRRYISEKIFDAFAIGAIPLYWAGPQHRAFELVPAGAMLNCHGLTAAAAGAKVAGFTPDAALAESWLATTRQLAALFGNGRAIVAERQRVAEAVLAEIRTLV